MNNTARRQRQEPTTEPDYKLSCLYDRGLEVIERSARMQSQLVEDLMDTGRTRVRRALNGVSVANARWMGNLLGRLSDKQLIDAFRAGGFNAAETPLYVSVLRARIIQFQRL